MMIPAGEEVRDLVKGKFDHGPSTRGLKAEAILLARCAILFWTVILLVLLVSLVGVVDLQLEEQVVAGAAMTYAGVLVAVVLSVGAAWGRHRGDREAQHRLTIRRTSPAPGDRDGLWDEWMDMPGSSDGH